MNSIKAISRPSWRWWLVSATRWAQAAVFAGLSLLIAAPGLAAAATLYVPVSGANRIIVVNTATDRIVAGVPGIINAHGLAITPDDRFLIAPSADESQCCESSAAESMSSGVAAHNHSSKGPRSAMGPTVGPSHVDIIRTTDLKIVRRIAFPTASHHIAASPDGTYAVITHRDNGTISILDMATATGKGTGSGVRDVKIGGAPAYAVISPDSRNIYVSDMMHNVVSIIDVSRDVVSKRIPVPGGPWHMTLSSDGRFLYAADVSAGTVSQISTSQKKVIQTIQIGGTLHGIDISPNGERLFVADMSKGRLVMVNLSNGSERFISLPGAFHVTTVPGSGLIAVTSISKPLLWLVSVSNLHIDRQMRIGGIGHQIAVHTPPAQ